MKYKIVASISLETGDATGYRFVNIEKDVDGSSLISFDQLFVQIEEESKEKYKDFKKLTNIRVYRT